MLLLKTILIAALAVTATVIKHDADSIQKSLEKINSGFVDLTNEINMSSGDKASLSFLKETFSKLQADADSFPSIVDGRKDLSRSEAKAIESYFGNTLAPNIIRAMIAMEANEDVIESAGLTSALDNLNVVKSAIGDMGAALIDGA